jgi:hypothetical protein
MRANLRKAAWMQGIAVAVIGIGVASATIAKLKQPFDGDTLAIQVEALQSHAAEASQLALLMREDQLAPGFVGEHAAQLADNVQRAQDALAGKDAEPAFEQARGTAQQLGASLHARLQSWSADGDLARTRDFGFDTLADQLDMLHTQLQPED